MSAIIGKLVPPCGPTTFMDFGIAIDEMRKVPGALRFHISRADAYALLASQFFDASGKQLRLTGFDLRNGYRGAYDEHGDLLAHESTIHGLPVGLHEISGLILLEVLEHLTPPRKP